MLALLKLHENTADKMSLYKLLEEKGGMEKATFEVPEGVTLLFGRRLHSVYNLAVLYDAEDEKTSLQFLSEFSPYATIERILTAACPLYENTVAGSEPRE